jgi:hypothetical protein
MNHRPNFLGACMTALPPLSRTALLATACALAASLAAAQAAPDDFSVGQHLSAEQVRALGALQRVEINDRPYRVLNIGVSANGLPVTTVVDRRGMVGQTYHELVIAEQPTDTVRQQAGALLTAAQVKYYDATDITVARFPNLTQAAAALPQIRAALPGAKVGLPITFDRRRSQ